MSDYPEHTKLRKTSNKRATISEFLSWLAYKKNLNFGSYGEYENENDERFYARHIDVEALIAEYFGIDLKEIEQERRQMLGDTK